jgi:hypothetical protein
MIGATCKALGYKVEIAKPYLIQPVKFNLTSMLVI